MFDEDRRDVSSTVRDVTPSRATPSLWYLVEMLDATSDPTQAALAPAVTHASDEASSSEASAFDGPAPRDLVLARVLTFGAVALSFPLSALAVFAFGVDRHAAADALSIVYSVGLVLALSTSFWPLPGLASWRREERIESLVVAFLAMSYATHLSWELLWLVLHDAIARNPDAPWAYPWWAYIDGGDARYARAEPLLLAMESLSVANGLVGAIALARWLRSGRTDRAAVLALTGTAVVHLYSASLYYLSEIVAGLPSVNTSSFVATYFKFALANAPWVVVPFFVFAWARRRLAPHATRGPRVGSSVAPVVSTILVLALASGCSNESSPATLRIACPTNDCAWLGGAGQVPRAPAGRTMRQIVGLAGAADTLDLHLQVAQELGHVPLRIDFYWHEMEPTKGTFDFTKYDAIVDAASAAGVPILAILDYGNPWASGVAGDPYYPPTDPNDFARFAGAVATHFRGRLLGYEIWNEPDVGFRFWKPSIGGDAEAYADLLAATYPSVHAADPATPVLLGGLAFTPQAIPGAIAFLEEAFTRAPTLGSSFDVAGIHTYQIYPPTAAPETITDGIDPPLVGKLQMFEWELAQHRASGKRIWITELGWPVFGPVDRPTQAHFLVRGLILAALAGAEHVFVYNLRDGPMGNDPTAFPPEDAFGLFEYVADPLAPVQLVPKPSYVALTALLDVTDGRTPKIATTRLTSLPSDAWTARFEGAGRAPVEAVWTVSTASASTTADRDVVVFDEDGTMRGTAAKGSAIAIGPSVTYLVDSEL